MTDPAHILKRADFIRQNWPLISPWQHAPFLRENAVQTILKEKWAEAEKAREPRYSYQRYGLSHWFDAKGQPLSPEKHAEADAVAERMMAEAMARDGQGR